MPPPGPKSRELLNRGEAVLYPGLAHGLAPFVAERKGGWSITDVDGNVFLDMVSASASVPFGAGRPDLVGAAAEALRRYGNEDTHGRRTRSWHRSRKSSSRSHRRGSPGWTSR